MTYLDLPNCFDEEIWENSDRLATAGFYTDRNDIPKYELTKNGFRVTLAGKEMDYDFYGYNMQMSKEKKMVKSDSSYIEEESEDCQ